MAIWQGSVTLDAVLKRMDRCVVIPSSIYPRYPMLHRYIHHSKILFSPENSSFFKTQAPPAFISVAHQVLILSWPPSHKTPKGTRAHEPRQDDGHPKDRSKECLHNNTSLIRGFGTSLRRKAITLVLSKREVLEPREHPKLRAVRHAKS